MPADRALDELRVAWPSVRFVAEGPWLVAYGQFGEELNRAQSARMLNGLLETRAVAERAQRGEVKP